MLMMRFSKFLNSVFISLHHIPPNQRFLFYCQPQYSAVASNPLRLFLCFYWGGGLIDAQDQFFWGIPIVDSFVSPLLGYIPTPLPVERGTQKETCVRKLPRKRHSSAHPGSGLSDCVPLNCNRNHTYVKLMTQSTSRKVIFLYYTI